MHWQKVTIIGVGLLGGSLGLALKKRRLAKSVVGFARRDATIGECRKRRVMDDVTLDLAEAVRDADLIILCTPLAQMRPLAEKIIPHLKRGTVITDVGSVKASVAHDLEEMFAQASAHFIGSHPMAGAEKTGVAAARADLFESSVCVVTPTRRSNKAAARRVETLWKSLGARTLRLSPEIHDDLVSRSSHLPHVLAAELANYVLSPNHLREQELLCANGFRDTTRIASGSPEMWRDIALANRKNLSRALEAVIQDLQQFQRVLKKGDQHGIEKFFESAKRRRDAWRKTATSVSPE